MKHGRQKAGKGDAVGREERGGVFGWLAGLDLSLLALMLAVKALVLLVGAQTFTLYRNEHIETAYGWLQIWNRWDAPHYLDIERDGYVSEGVESRWIVFYPLYPWAVRLCAYVLADELLAAFFVSTVASLAAGLLLYRLAGRDETDATARASVFFLFIFPTSYFLHIGYTESLFLALTLGSFLSARERRWWQAGVLGALAGLARVNGLMLIPALAFEAYSQYREEGRRWRWEWLWVCFAGVGFACYLLVNASVFGDAFAFLKTQDVYWHKSLTWPWVGLTEAWNAVWSRAPSEAQMVGWQELFFVLLGLGGTVWCWFRLRASYAVWMTTNWLLWTSTKFVLSVPRYTLILFPLYILFARKAAERPAWGGVITVWSLLLLALFAGRFALGMWAF
jgi:Gpi18-like mannosyltransferase